MPNEHEDQGPQGRLASEFAHDAEMGELINQFLDELPERMAGLQSALETGDEQRLRRIAHQLKGAAASYGYPTITDTAATLERTILEEEAAVSALKERVEDLISLCQCAVRSNEIERKLQEGEQ